MEGLCLIFNLVLVICVWLPFMRQEPRYGPRIKVGGRVVSWIWRNWPWIMEASPFMTQEPRYGFKSYFLVTEECELYNSRNTRRASQCFCGKEPYAIVWLLPSVNLHELWHAPYPKPKKKRRCSILQEEIMSNIHMITSRVL